MNSVPEIQNSLARLIFSISDPENLRRIKKSIEEVIADTSPIQERQEPPSWAPAIAKIKPIPSFAQVVKEQDKPPLLFSEIDLLLEDVDEEEAFTVDDLLEALN